MRSNYRFLIAALLVGIVLMVLMQAGEHAKTQSAAGLVDTDLASNAAADDPHVSTSMLHAVGEGGELGMASSEQITGPATVVDGDTLIIGGSRIRLFGIDAPEKDQTCASQDGSTIPCGQLASNALQRLIASDAVRCIVHTADRYGRPVAGCVTVRQTAQGLAVALDLNHEMVARGLAYADARDSQVYEATMLRARANAQGFWVTEFEKPSEFRRRSVSQP